MTDVQKQCPYCHGREGKPLIDEIDIVYVNGDESELIEDQYETGPLAVPIHYCPMCGRRLEAEQWD